MSLFDTVERALNNAVPAPATGPVFPLSSDYARYARAPDTEPIHLNPELSDQGTLLGNNRPYPILAQRFS